MLRPLGSCSISFASMTALCRCAALVLFLCAGANLTAHTAERQTSATQQRMTAADNASKSEDSKADDADDDEIDTDRPDFTNSPETVPAGTTQLESGYTYNWSRGSHEHDIGELLLREGLTTHTELRLAFNSLVLLNDNTGFHSGREDCTLGFKHQLSEGSETFDLLRPKIAIDVEATFPSGSGTFREPHLQPEVSLLLGWDIDKNWSLTSNLNWGMPSNGGKSFNQFAATASLARKLGKKLEAYGETYALFPQSPDSHWTQFVDCGLTYKVTKDYQLDVEVGTALNGDNPTHYAGVGFGIRF